MKALEEKAERTSLAGRAEAETTISRLMRQGRPAFALTILANDVPRINEQYGYRTGDRILAALAHKLAAGGPSREVFRWSATSFLVVSHSLRRVTEASRVRGATTAIFDVSPGDRPSALFDRIDLYIATRLACSEAA